MASGRKSRYEEFKRGNLLQITTNWLCENFNSFTKEEKLRVALTIAPKGVSDKLEVEGMTQKAIIVIRSRDMKDSEVEVPIG